MKKTTLMLLSAVLMFSSSVWAAPLNRTQVPADVKWVIHVDFDTFATSEIWRLVNQEISNKYQKEIDAITNLFGFNPTEDIFGVTLYGIDSNEENAVFMLYGRFDKEKLLSLLALNEAYAESEYNGQKLYHWLDEKDNQEKVGIFAADALIVISRSEQAVKSMIDLLSGKKTSLASQNDAPLAKLIEAPENAFMIMAADGDMYLHIDLTAETQEAAMQIEQILVGIKAFIVLKHAKQPEILSLLEATKLEQSENELFLTVQYPSDKLFEIIKAMHKVDIWSAAATGNTEAIKQQLLAGKDINAKEPAGGSTPLIVAATYGQIEAVRLLIEKGADINTKNNNGSTALHAAAFLAHPEIVKLLLDKGADVNARNNRGETAIYIATLEWNPELEGIYRWLGGILKIELDIERIKAVRPEIADLLRRTE